MADSNFSETDVLMPAMFVGHGNPMNAITDNAYRRSWQALGQRLPRPQAILCISAHWETDGTLITGSDMPRTIHDFHGFPQALFDVQYPAPGSPALACLIHEFLPEVQINLHWGLDHGAWSVLMPMFPDAGVPVLQLSLDRSLSAKQHYELGQKLACLRRRGVLVVASGNMVHNLGQLIRQEEARHDWAITFDTAMREAVRAGDHEAVIRYRLQGEVASLAVPTPEHFLPLLYILGMQQPEDRLDFFNEGVSMGALSMTSVLLS